MTAEERMREKAKSLRYRKAIVRDINLAAIQERLWDIQEECDNVRYYFEDDGDTLLNALDGDEEQEQEFKMMFTDLCTECEQMSCDLENEYVPGCFDDFFTAIGAGDLGGGLFGWDSYEADYFGIDCPDYFAEEESQKRLSRLTKAQLIDAAHACFRVFYAYIGLQHRYDCLKAALDILKDENTAYLQLVSQINETYEKAAKSGFYDLRGETANRDFDKLLNSMPQLAWI